MNKKLNKLITFTIISLLIIAFCGCKALRQAFMNTLKNPEADAAAEQLIKDILNNDLSDVEEVLHPSASAALDGDYSSLIQIGNAIEGDFLLFEMISVDLYSTNGVTTTSYNVVYLLTTTTNNTYNIQTQWLEDKDGKGFNEFLLTEEIEVPLNTNTLSRFSIAMIIFSIIMGVIAIFSLIVCINTKMIKKPIFILLIIILFCGFTITYNNGFNFSINFLFGFYSKYAYEGTVETFSLNMPLGAILFLALRKKLKKEYITRQNALMALFNPKPPAKSENSTVVTPLNEVAKSLVINPIEDNILIIKNKKEEISLEIKNEDNIPKESK